MYNFDRFRSVMMYLMYRLLYYVAILLAISTRCANCTIYTTIVNVLNPPKPTPPDPAPQLLFSCCIRKSTPTNTFFLNRAWQSRIARLIIMLIIVGHIITLLLF